ncbi:putative hydro-lyase [Corynebacterium uberis]|uniref:putative hydro-lyase n=1 Tax=Corynebacterium TaxID=1716 RepID=UPI001D0A340D|nr:MULTISPECIES: putative hydro-lyase [Corynebacterium]MCZ9308816.1 putative hydro-lyase [Corynebacterium sp. c6VSa_13]UDL72657.1 putative hydro-lyase [Corynebacterium uberis]UDL76467.1 putative hydro-lyase [Corynebacterium uberis]UDL78679.1 putative hydro-lyase [Corynebacterium uberis]UDL80958.1 putative hydro-lyase [Corynebacterium uberis]
MDYAQLSPAQARQLAREGLVAPTAGWCRGFTQVNLACVPRELAFDFLLFAQRNPKSCPVIGVIEPGQITDLPLLGPEGDVRRDCPAYRVFRNGELVDQVPDARDFWRADLVSFLIGCSFTFETALLEAGVPVAHIEQGRNVPMYRTNRQCRPAGAFSGPLVVSMRPIPASQVADAVRISARYPSVHGAPVHVGDPAALGIADLQRPDFGDAVDIASGSVPVFWACGVTPQAAIMESRPDLAITHAPGHMLITDARDSAYQVP